MKFWEWLAIILIIIGALNWGSIGFFRFDFVAFVFGTLSVVSRVIYAVIGLAGIYFIIFLVEKE
ncbi:MAG: DUF378 domain-containing protein [Patescibacteria group bacterium]|nr:DUF378 domain-containing protein [Patescibacteria group bacterium]